MKPPVVLRALDDFSFHEPIGKVGIAVRADAVGRKQRTARIPRQRISPPLVIEPDDIFATKQCRIAPLHPAIIIGPGSRWGHSIRVTGLRVRQPAFDVPCGILHLPEDGGNNLPPRIHKTAIRRRQSSFTAS